MNQLPSPQTGILPVFLHYPPPPHSPLKVTTNLNFMSIILFPLYSFDQVYVHSFKMFSLTCFLFILQKLCHILCCLLDLAFFTQYHITKVYSCCCFSLTYHIMWTFHKPSITHFLVNGHLGNSPNFAITNNATTNILAQVSWVHVLKFLLEYT